jgi:hypothetical protein
MTPPEAAAAIAGACLLSKNLRERSLPQKEKSRQVVDDMGTPVDCASLAARPKTPSTATASTHSGRGAAGQKAEGRPWLLRALAVDTASSLPHNTSQDPSPASPGCSFQLAC